jgi:hypothetical protein
MYIRCADCSTTTRVPPGFQDRGVTCISCGRVYRLERVGELGPTPGERYQRALDYADEHDIDLATAYSVLLGILPPGQGPARDRRQDTRATPAESAASPKAAAEVPYDPGFISTVAEGNLTLQQAIERGDRVAYASKVARRHDLPMHVAFLVADNRLGLREARENRAAAGHESLAAGHDSAAPPAGDQAEALRSSRRLAMRDARSRDRPVRTDRLRWRSGRGRCARSDARP